MADYHTMLVNASMALDDIEKIEFKSELMNDPVKSQQYASERQNKQADETLQIKRGNFQKAFYDMGRYMDMDHHARYYEVRNGDLNRAQNNIVSIAEANTSSLRFDMDNTKRQFLVNEWYAQNKLESLFFLQVAFLAMVSAMIVIMLGKMNLFPWIFGKYIVFIIASAAAILKIPCSPPVSRRGAGRRLGWRSSRSLVLVFRWPVGGAGMKRTYRAWSPSLSSCFTSRYPIRLRGSCCWSSRSL